jgi:hypothetical protein
MAELFPVDISNKCRVCRCDRPEELIRPCACTGANEWAHAGCLPTHRGKEAPEDACDECGTPFSFDKNEKYCRLQAVIFMLFYFLTGGIVMLILIAVCCTSLDIGVFESLNLVSGVIVACFALFFMANFPNMFIVCLSGGRCYERPLSRLGVVFSMLYYTILVPTFSILIIQATRTADKSPESGASAAGEDKFAGLSPWKSAGITLLGVIGLLLTPMFVYYSMDRKTTTWTVADRAPAKADDAA